MRYLVAALVLALLAGVSRAQVANPGAYSPNMYNRAAQPLSPYLNLLRGGNNAVNYFYGVRPGTQPGAFMGMFNQQGAAARQTFFPGADTLADLLEDPRDATKVSPTGHATTFNNTLNYFGQTSGQFYSRGQQQQIRRR